MSCLILDNCRVLDLDRPDEDRPLSIAIENGCIAEIAESIKTRKSFDRMDIRRNWVMPGLIDCHVHVMASLSDLVANERLSDVQAILGSIPILEGMLSRGFTTVRDAAGAERALADAITSGAIKGPRLIVAGKGLCQTGGHGDFRQELTKFPAGGQQRRAGGLARVADGVDAVRLAVREELQAGAHHIKIMASGGCASERAPIDATNFSLSEIDAVVEEARARGAYVMAHAYTPKAISRVVERGVRTVEHCNLIDEATAGMMAEAGAYAVPTLAIYDTMLGLGEKAQVPALALEKARMVMEGGLCSLEILSRAGVPMGYGTDLLGPTHAVQRNEFMLRTQVLAPLEVLRQATLVGAEIVGMKGKIGTISQNAFADLLILDRNPVEDISVLATGSNGMLGIMKEGIWYERPVID